MKKIMTRAWEIFRTLTTGTRLEKLSIALKRAWKEVKTMVKKTFEKIAVVARCENPDTDSRCEYLTFKAWSKGDKKRIYISDYKNRTLGFIDRTTGETIINDNQGMHQHEVDFALNAFLRHMQYNKKRESHKNVTLSRSNNTSLLISIHARLSDKYSITNIY